MKNRDIVFQDVLTSQRSRRYPVRSDGTNDQNEANSAAALLSTKTDVDKNVTWRRRSSTTDLSVKAILHTFSRPKNHARNEQF